MVPTVCTPSGLERILGGTQIFFNVHPYLKITTCIRRKGKTSISMIENFLPEQIHFRKNIDLNINVE